VRTAATKDEFVADFRIASTRVSAAAAFVILILSDFPAPRCGATVYHSDGSEANVRALHNSAHDGDTITLPSGTFSWTNCLNITKGITLQGTTTIDGAGTSNPAVTDATIILDNTPRTGPGVLGIIRIRTTSSQFARVTGITFRADASTKFTRAGGVNPGSSGNGPASIRVDHCHFDQICHAAAIWVNGWVYGVADNNLIEFRGSTYAFHIDHDLYNGNFVGPGNGSWADYPWYGTSKFWFIETNTIRKVNATTFGATLDCSYGARWVARHNYLLNNAPEGHGTEGGNYRGQRVNEFYNNTINMTVNWNGGGSRGGTQMWHDNIILGNEPTADRISSLANYRVTWIRTNPVWGVADGSSPWDKNDTEGNGTYVEGHAPFLFDSGTATSANVVTNRTSTFTDSTKNWTPNQWAGYHVRNPDPTVKLGAIIQSNTSNSITYTWEPVRYGGRVLNFNVGDRYEIHRVLTVMDGCGMGKGDLVRGNPPINTVTGTPFWPHEAIEPCYSWNNIYQPNGHVLVFKGSAKQLLPPRENFEYFNLGGGFPAGTTPSEVLYRYNAALNGVQYTGTFAYPHPLVTAQPLVAAQPPSTQCSQLQRRLDRLQRRQGRLEQRHRSNPRLGKRIRRLQLRLQRQHCP
jgi:hypothetical protein